MSALARENVRVAFSLVILAGAATGIGAAVVFFPSLIKLASRKALASALGFSAGVMTYVSYIEIFPKSLKGFQDAGHNSQQAFGYSSLCFFAGIGIMSILNTAVARLLHTPDKNPSGGDPSKSRKGKAKAKGEKTAGKLAQTQQTESWHSDVAPQSLCCSKDPNGQLDRLHAMGRDLEEGNVAADTIDMEVDDDFIDNLPIEEIDDSLSESAEEMSVDGQDTVNDKDEKKHLVAMGTKTALAIAMHNFPEGLATFITALADPQVGVVLAIAIAIHNIPEGLCVALPIYYGTGDRITGFKWALLSGASEVFAALLGWLVLANVVSDNLFGALFGAVAGMMAIISVRELVPTAHFYDPEDKVVTNSYVGGAAIMAASLVLFNFFK